MVNDILYGEESLITLTDAEGVISDIKVKLGYPVITGLKYYMVSKELETINNDDTDPASYINTGSLATLPKRQFDYSNPITGSDTSSYSGLIELIKGEAMEVFIVPVFSNIDRNNMITNGNYWEYASYDGQIIIEGINQTSTFLSPSGGGSMYSITQTGTESVGTINDNGAVRL